MRLRTLLLAAVALTASAQDDAIKTALARVSEEAEAFYRAAPNLVAQETLQQKARKNPGRFHPRLGSAALEQPKPQYLTREIVSEYGFGIFRASPGALHEFRQVVSVDGKQVAPAGDARHALALGMRSEDDRLKKRMLEQFERHGLAGATADFGQVILLFTRRKLGDYSFSYAGEGRAGADSAVILNFRQSGGAGSLLIFESRKAVHNPLQGQLWIRRQDSVPLRVVLTAARNERGYEVRDEATVDYAMSPHGVIVPVSVVHRQYAGPELMVENIYRYGSFRKFSADADIKFSEQPAVAK